MIVFANILFVEGVIGLYLAGEMYGDIGVAAVIGAISAISSGIAFLFVFLLYGRKLKNIPRNDPNNLDKG
jgi:hypothetical protein